MTEWIDGCPEDIGLPANAVSFYLGELDKLGISIHGLLLYQNGKLVSEHYSREYGQQKLHPMYSITKSYVSLAVGLLADKSLIRLDDPITNYFPKYVPKCPHPWLMEMTIKDMLKMQTCHKKTTYKKDPTQNWTESFFTTLPDHRPGSAFYYDTSASHTLGALVEKLTGLPLLDYLRKEFLHTIGFSSQAYISRDFFGVSDGGSGLMATPQDLLRTGILVINQGCWNGKQIYPDWYLKEAAAKQTETDNSRFYLDECQGYGYQFWRFRHGGYGCYGMNGQYILCFPSRDCVCVITADTVNITGGHQKILDNFYEYILAYIPESI